MEDFVPTEGGTQNSRARSQSSVIPLVCPFVSPAVYTPLASATILYKGPVCKLVAVIVTLALYEES